MSLASIRDKIAKGGKQKTLPKLKTILANPYKAKCPTLPEDELQQLEDLLCTAITESGQQARAFATTKRICLGLESSLRNINNSQSACVLLSLSIKPSHLISLIARNVEIKNQTCPVYAQPKLEQFTEKVFGVRALILVLPLNMPALSAELNNWVQSRSKPKKISKEVVKIVPKVKEKVKKKADSPKSAQTTKQAIVATPPIEHKSFSGDFISFSSTCENMVVDKTKLNQDKEHLLNALSKMAERVPSAISTNVEFMDIDAVEASLNTEPTTVPPVIRSEIASDSDEFIQEDDYQSLTVHKIRPNPDKKPKKKRKKNKNKKKL